MLNLCVLVCDCSIFFPCLDFRISPSVLSLVGIRVPSGSFDPLKPVPELVLEFRYLRVIARITNKVVSEFGQKLWLSPSNWYQSHILKNFRRGSKVHLGCSEGVCQISCVRGRGQFAKFDHKEFE